MLIYLSRVLAERKVVRDLNFFSNQVAVTGLARFDELFNPNVEVKNQILIIPTWRDWLTSIDRLQTSEYLKRMNDFFIVRN